MKDARQINPSLDAFGDETQGSVTRSWLVGAQMRTVSAEAAAAATAACPRFEQLLSQLRMLAADTEVHGGDGGGGDTKARSAPCVGFILGQPYGHDVRSATHSCQYLCSNFLSALHVGTSV